VVLREVTVKATEHSESVLVAKISVPHTSLLIELSAGRGTVTARKCGCCNAVR
jgi:hypothetical protein